MTCHLLAISLLADAAANAASDEGWFALLQDKARELVMSTVLIVLLLIVRFWLVNRFLRQDELPGEVRRRLMVNTRNATLLGLVLGLVLIWGSELQSMAISLFAIAAALVLATKEVILCISGAFVRSQMFSVGDRVSIKERRGDVIDKSVLTTRLLEIGPGDQSHQYTGRVLIVPNSELLSGGVANESALGDFLIHVVTIPLKLENDWRQAREHLLAAARVACADYLPRAVQHFAQLEQQSAHYAPSADPRVTISLPEPDRIDLHVRFPIPKGRKQRIQQILINEYLNRVRTGPAPSATGTGSAGETTATATT